MATTDLTNTTWAVPAGWSAKHNYGTFSVDYNYEYGTSSGSQTTLRIGFDNGSGDNGDNIIGFSTESIYPATAFTIIITGGADATNPYLISWLESNGELQTLPAPTGVTIQYKDTTISIKDGQAVTLHTTDKKFTEDLEIIAPESTVEDWDGTIVVKGGMISFAIGSTSYEAEEGMTWSEWVESDYNPDYDYSPFKKVYTGGSALYLNDYGAGQPIKGASTNDVIIAGYEYALANIGGGSN